MVCVEMGMKPCELQSMLTREWQEQGKHKSWYPSPEAQVVTGNPTHDAQLHRILTEHGIEIKLNTRFNEIQDYRVIDEQKFLMFVLRWT
jgi:hypothetical protein